MNKTTEALKQEREPVAWHLDAETAKFLADMITADDEPTEITLRLGFVRDDDGKVQYGLLVEDSEYPEEGACLLVECEPLNAAPVQPVKQEPVAIDGLARACNLAGIDYKDFLRIKAYLPIAAPVRQAEQEPVHESLQIAAVALQDIACSSQTNNLLWWQIRAREAQKQIAERLTNSAPAEPVKQEPVAFMFKVKRTTKATTVLDEFAAIDYFPQDNEEIVSKEPLLYAAPVDAKAIRAEALEDAVKFLEENGMIAHNGFTAAGIRGLK